MYKIILIKENGKIDITKMCGSLSWENDIEMLGTKLMFDVVRNRSDLNFKNLDIVNIGDKVILLDDTEEIFRGVIVDLSWEKFKKSITCFDYAFYLNKSKTIIQFYNISATKAIEMLVNKFNVPIGEIDNMSTNISKIYKDKTIAEIIKDVLLLVENETNIKHRLEMNKGKLDITQYKEIEIEVMFNVPNIVIPFSLNDMQSSFSKRESIEEMKNSILVSSKEQEDNRIIKTEQDQTSINKFGLLQDVLKVDEFDESQTSNVAKNKLKELNKIKTEISLETLGDNKFKAGRIINVKNKNFDVNGKYLIAHAFHNVNNNIHRCTLDLEVI